MTGFEEVYSAYFRDVYLYVLGLSGEVTIAEDVTEETFLRAMRALPEFRGECDIRVWLCQIAKNEYYQYLRKQKKEVLTDFSEEQSLQATGSVAEAYQTDVAEQLADADMAMRIHRVLHELPEPYKEVFQLRVFGELSFEQIATVFGKTANWACVTFHRAKAKLQKEMEGWK